MSRWFSKNLGNGTAAVAPTLEIQTAFGNAAAAAGLPTDMALFSKHDMRGNVSLYFSPGASDFAKTWGAQPCEKPEKEGLSLLVGHAFALEHFYPYPKGVRK